MLEVIDTKIHSPQAIVLSPPVNSLSRFKMSSWPWETIWTCNATRVLVAARLTKTSKFDYGQHIVSGTPGRVADMIRRQYLDTRNIKMLILDEADTLLEKGFQEQIYEIYRYLPPATQVVVVSATLPHDVLALTKSSWPTLCESWSSVMSWP